jgi:hypothetical protein
VIKEENPEEREVWTLQTLGKRMPMMQLRRMAGRSVGG